MSSIMRSLVAGAGHLDHIDDGIADEAEESGARYLVDFIEAQFLKCGELHGAIPSSIKF
ncbi:TPA: hypothetical protein ACJYEA_001750 [Pseudomonas aeruginosa]